MTNGEVTFAAVYQPPSLGRQTEILAAVGLAGGKKSLTGITENCDYLEDIRRRPCFGSWYAPDLPRVIAACPDLA
jgi:hypothetical protein